MMVLMTPTIEKLITGEELQAMGDIGPCELIDGRIVMMDATGSEHGEIEGNFYEAIKNFARPHNLGRVQVGEVGIYISRNPDRVRAADVLFISLERYAQQKNKRAYLEVAPELIVEILSPDDRATEVNKKLRDYFSIGVQLVWVVDHEEKTVLAYHSLTAVRAFAINDTLTAEDVLPGFAVPLSQLFET